MSARPWSGAETEFLRRNYLDLEHEEIGRRLGRSRAAVRNQCYELGLRKKADVWTAEEDSLLRELYARFSERLFLSDAARQLGRSRTGVASRASKLGLTDRRRPIAAETVRKIRTSPRSYRATRNGLGASTHGGLREDLGIYVRSTWEANYARYLNWLKARGDIVDWSYEAETFEFPVKRGTRFYTPDFKVLTDLRGPCIEFHEVKGYMDPKSRTALNRMGRYHPDVKVLVIDGPVYKDLRRKLGRLIPGWEDPPAAPAWPAEDAEQLVRWWEQGVHANEIATRLGKSVNAVCVRAQRLGVRRPAQGVGDWFPGRRRRK